jgi:exopolyphosphatase/guanosine-5'-triphosphate,3'-diphosphate pyrophosphatase
MKIAILDFGTNTFNLLISDTGDPENIKYLHSSKQPVKLGEGGINRGFITDEAMARGMKALAEHYKIIKQHKVEKIYGYATSAVREAKNGKAFLKNVREKYDLYVNIIPGDREAELIYKGVRQSCSLGKDKVLILDIGGGSNEFIICDQKKIYWKESFKLGMARMLEQFHPEDPIEDRTLKEIEKYFNHELSSLFDAVKKYEPKTLVGASGSFETFYALLSHKLPEKYPDINTVDKEIYGEDFRGLHEILLKSTLSERKNMKGMEPVRVEMIVLASIFVNFTIRECNINKILFSDYALKEGIIAELLNI